MKRLPRSELTESAETVEARSLGVPQGDSAELLWAKLYAFERALPDLLEAALRRLLDEELSLAPSHVRATARGLFERAAVEHGPFVLRVHPDDRPLVEDLPPSCTIDDDPTLRRGGCVLSSPVLELNASVEARLERVLRALRG